MDWLYLNVPNDVTSRLPKAGSVGVPDVSETSTPRNKIKTVDIFGEKTNTILFAIYDNGDVEKTIMLQ